MVLSIGTHWVELLFPLRSDVELMPGTGGFPLTAVAEGIARSFLWRGSRVTQSFVCLEELIPQASEARAFMLVR